ncbi:peptide-methionine (S)-S-oxide reductase MsrA [Patescibacteria group bacterium]
MGCFWGAEEILRKVKGVQYTVVGYMGGKVDNPTYERVCGGDTGHIETVYLKFNPSIISYKDLLGIFWKNHNPTTLDRQGLDIGSQYRSIIFYYNQKQKETAEELKRQLGEGDRFKDPIVTQIIPASVFYPAEEYHQQYIQKKSKIF